METASMTARTTTVEKAVREALKAVRPDIGVIDGGADLMREIGLDSVQVMDLIMEIEDRLDTSVPVELLAEIRTLDQLCAGIVQLADGTPREPV
jgi:acyl carrier protein